MPELAADHVVPNRLGNAFIGYSLEEAGLDCRRVAPLGLKPGEHWDDEVFTAGRLREAFAWIAARRGLDESLLRMRLCRLCDDEAKPVRRKLEKHEMERDHLSRERRLPDPQRLETLARYEAHLGREPSRTMKALRELQARAGDPRPVRAETPEDGSDSAHDAPLSAVSRELTRSNGNGFHRPLVPLVAKKCETNSRAAALSAGVTVSRRPVVPVLTQRLLAVSVLTNVGQGWRGSPFRVRPIYGKFSRVRQSSSSAATVTGATGEELP